MKVLVKYCFTLTLIIFSAFPVFSQVNEDSTNSIIIYNEYMKKGMNFSNSGDFDEAIIWFTSALKIKEGDTEATKMLNANLKRKAERQEEMNRQKVKLLEAADKKFGEGNYKKALEYYEKYKSMDPTLEVDEKIKLCKEKIDN